MSFDVSGMLENALKSVKELVDVNSVVGKPVYCDGENTVIPISKICVGFVTAGGEIDNKYGHRAEELPIGGIGGGLTILPLGFLIINSGNARMIKIEGDGNERWLEILQQVIQNISK